MAQRDGRAVDEGGPGAGEDGGVGVAEAGGFDFEEGLAGPWRGDGELPGVEAAAGGGFEAQGLHRGWCCGELSVWIGWRGGEGCIYGWERAAFVGMRVGQELCNAIRTAQIDGHPIEGG